ncbi:hypothetical protein QQ045_030323 [Rhodiola kirilowii]
MNVVRTVSYKIEVNDRWTNDICRNRGLRMVERKANDGSLRGIKIARNAPIITHLLFADDSLIYLHANTMETNEIKGILSRKGLPFVIGLNKKKHFRTVNDSVQKKLADWKYRLLSVAGMEGLIKSTVQSVPIFLMQYYKIPKSLNQSLQSAALRFFWGGKGESRVVHWLNKETLQKQKSLGGLGFKDPEMFNSALLMKQLRRMIKIQIYL